MSEKINITILIVPLDWGLGHSTRIIPLARHIMQLGHTVVFAAEGAQARLLQQEFYGVEILPVEGYRVKYAATGIGLAFKMLRQLPRIYKAIKKENRWLQQLLATRKIDAVIADNRYGLFHAKTPSVIISHQLCVNMPVKWMERLVQKITYSYINRFNACWVPDAAKDNGLAGKLSHPASMPAVPVKYIGPISRMEPAKQEIKQWDVLVLLSGPEPQRTLLEQKIIDQLPVQGKLIMIVRGLPHQHETPEVAGATVVNHLPAAQLQQVMAQSKLIICRSGYSTIMDLCMLQQAAVLIATPGQTEQEYLAKYLNSKGWCYAANQQDLSLEHLLTNTMEEKRFPPMQMETYKQVISDWLEEIKQRML